MHQVTVYGKGVFLAGMTLALDCTRYSGAVFEQYKLITGKSLTGVLGMLEGRCPCSSSSRAEGGVDGEDREVECLPMECSDMVYEEVYLF